VNPQRAKGSRVAANLSTRKSRSVVFPSQESLYTIKRAMLGVLARMQRHHVPAWQSWLACSRLENASPPSR
jgi:hypothetical protein